MQHDINPSAYQDNPDSLKRCRRAAALQAAAPDLLDALRTIVANAASVQMDPQWAVQVARAAIDKATKTA